MDKMSEKERMNEMIEAIMKAARGDYSVQVELSGKNDDLDSLAMGLNMMVDDIRTSEEALRESEEKFRTFMESASDLMLIADKDGKFTYVNDSMVRTLGYSKEELSGMYITQILTKEALEKDFKPKWDKFITNGEISLETTVATKDGKDIYGEIKAVGVYDSDGNYAGSRTVFRDITERKRIEHALNERVKELQCLYDIAYIAERPGITLDELCQEVVSLLPAGWQYPEITCARVTLGDKEFMTDNFKTTEWKLSTNIKVKEQKEGSVEVHYLEARPEFAEGPFVKEERLLIDVVAERLGRITEREQAEEALRSFNKLAVGREFRMIELKKEINNILRKLGEEPRYKIVE